MKSFHFDGTFEIATDPDDPGVIFSIIQAGKIFQGRPVGRPVVGDRAGRVGPGFSSIDLRIAARTAEMGAKGTAGTAFFLIHGNGIVQPEFIQRPGGIGFVQGAPVVLGLVLHERYALAHRGMRNHGRRAAGIARLGEIHAPQGLVDLVKVVPILDIDNVPVSCGIVGADVLGHHGVRASTDLEVIAIYNAGQIVEAILRGEAARL